MFSGQSSSHFALYLSVITIGVRNHLCGYEGLRVAQAEDGLSDAVGDGWKVELGEGRCGVI